MRPILLLIGFFGLSAAGQVSNTLPWTWINGDNSNNNFTVYGTLGVPASSNKPGGREGGGIEWTDASGNFWLFGGNGYGASGTGFMNDLWKYDRSTGYWTWMKGDNTLNQAGVYGTQGTAAAANKPGARYLSAAWTDNAGNLWLFGGNGYDASGTYGQLNDLWKYNISSNQWTWMKGDNTVNNMGTYGTKNVAAPTNKPGARNRFNQMTGREDIYGNLWMFGGAGYATTSTYGPLNDLWKYNISSNQWTWVTGDNTINNLGVYGSIGVPAAANKPGSRVGGVCWVDTAGRFWLFGGGYDAGGGWTNKLSDLWKFEPTTGYWTWMKGDNVLDQLGVYGTIGVTNSLNNPGGRLMASCWLDNLGNFWLFGGYGWAAAGTGSNGNQGLSDLWEYDPLTNNWTWMKGDNTPNQTSNYGTMGIAASTNKPGNRSGEYQWIDYYGNLWLFGGLQWGSPTVFKNDLWKLVIPQPVAKGNLSSCQQLPDITINATNNNTWVPIYDSIGNVAAEINANNNSLGTVSTKLYTQIAHCREDGNYKLYLNRNITLTPQVQPSSAVSVRTYILDSELDSIRVNLNSQGQPTGVATVNQLDVFKNNDTCRTVGRQMALPLSASTGSYYSDYYLDVNVSSFSSFYFSNKTYSFVLPLKIRSFTGWSTGPVNQLKWEADCSSDPRFLVERSVDGRNFQTIGRINATIVDCGHSFYFTDPSPYTITNYYRIKIEGLNQQVQYSPVILLAGEKGPSLVIQRSWFSSPSLLQLQVSSRSGGLTYFVFTDITGKMILQRRIQLQPGSQFLELDLPTLAKGIYLVYGMNDAGRSPVVKIPGD